MVPKLPPGSGELNRPVIKAGHRSWLVSSGSSVFLTSRADTIMTRHSIILIVLGLCVAWVSGASNMVFKKVEVNMGNVGSDDDMRIKICDKSKCCTTKVLSHLLKSEWVAKKKETWDGSDLGNCSSILFDENLSSIEVALLKDGKKNGPEVNSMKLTGQIGSDKKKTTAFNCGQYKFTAKDTIKSNFCTKDSTSSANRGTPTTSRTTTRSSSSSRTTPNMAFKKIVVQMGAVGSDDDMRLRICDTSKCCTTKKLSHLLSSEWVAKKKETWDGSDLGNCSSILFDQNLSSVEVAILKNGVKSAPEITSMEVTGQIGSDKKKTQVYKCGSYKFSKNDAQETNFCLKGSSSSANRATTTAKPKPTTKRPSSSSSTPSMVFKKVVVQMGAVGSDDDMSLKICDPSKCCTTKKLSHLLSSEWVAKKKETWDGSDLGNCSSILFDQHLSSVEVAILKNGKKSAPEITSMEVSGQVGSDKKNIQVFKCGSYKFTKTDAQKTSFCLNNKAPPKPTTRPSSPSSTPGTHQVNNVIVQVGNDGSNDEISLDVSAGFYTNNHSGISLLLFYQFRFATRRVLWAAATPEPLTSPWAMIGLKTTRRPGRKRGWVPARPRLLIPVKVLMLPLKRSLERTHWKSAA